MRENIYEEKNIVKQIFAGFFFQIFCLGSGLRVEIKSKSETSLKLLGKIFIANHQQFFDLVWLGVAIKKYLGRKKKCYFLVHRHNFESLSWRILSWWLPIFYVDLEDQDLLKKLEEILSNGDSIFLFPEGTYNLCGKGNRQLLPFYHGASNLALAVGADVVPVGISSPCALFKYSPFPSSGKSAMKILWHFFSGKILGREVVLKFGKTTSSPTPLLIKERENKLNFGKIKKFTEILEKSVADLADLEVPKISQLQVLCKEGKQQKIQAILKNMGIYCEGDITLHWRTAGVLEKIWECGGQKNLEIFLPKNCVIGEKIYLCPNQKIKKKNLGKNKVVGDWSDLEHYLIQT